MDYILPILLFLVGILCIVKGGDWFVDASSGIARASGIPKFIIGATIVSLATTLPELLVSILAAVEGKTEMAIGNAIGSVSANTGLILAVSIICVPMIMKRKQFMFKAILLLITMATLLLFSMNGELGVAGIVVMFLIFGVFVFDNIKEAKNSGMKEDREVFTKKEWITNIILFAIGALGIVIGSKLLVDNGSKLATMLGVPENIIALTMLAIGTSLPELVTAIASIVKKEGSLSVGNIIGANIIDTALILPICAVIGGGTLAVSHQVIALDIPVGIIVAMIIFVPSMFTQKFSRFQGVAAICVYVGYIVKICFFA
ncbi:MAG: calcium/sodium antiporter [Clostridia bacterium]